ncbi:hypothetical protein KY290_027906 [Solanum tuberosum]|uniref:CCHC-type domain-containing protein n=1 Tax=Solanum tuberosum TaxID=4113 RepID=A0ABQ7UI37_SOLTU|nr:hypothetical protein KY290_027906 [Solanum tuberosum]
MQFLEGLNESHSQARRQILMKITEPTLNQAYAMIIKEESQKYDMDCNTVGMKTVTEGNDLTTFWAAKQPPKPRYKNPNAFCDHCNSKGHMRGDCYQLIGYPPWFKGKKKEGCNVQYNTSVSPQNSQVLSPEYGVHKARHMIAPSHGNLSFSQNHNGSLNRLEEIVTDLVIFLVIFHLHLRDLRISIEQ